MTDDPVGPGLRVPAVSGGDLVDQLRSTLERAGELVRVLEGTLRSLEDDRRVTTSGERIGDLERRLDKADADVSELATQLVESEHQANRLMNLYVATYQLHSSLAPGDVQATIAEIVVNLLGAERFVLLLRSDGGGYEVAIRAGFEGAPDSIWSRDQYDGGDGMVDATLADGVLRQGPSPDSSALAAVPLRVEGEIVGAVVLLKLLDHKPVLGSDDRDLLDLLSAHAASALVAARLFTAKERRLRTLESLVKLARGE